MWSSEAPATPFEVLDVSAATAAECPPRTVVTDYVGNGRVIGYTVLYASGQRQRAVALLDLPGGQRTLAVCEDPDSMARMEQQEHVGTTVAAAHGAFTLQ